MVSRPGISGNGSVASGQTEPASKGPWLDDVSAIAIEVRRLFDIQIDRVRIRARRRVAYAVLLVPLILALASMAISAGWFVVTGLVALLRDPGGAPAWLAELGAGLAVLAVFALATGVWMRLSEAHEMRVLQEKYADPQREPDPPQQPDPQRESPSAHA